MTPSIPYPPAVIMAMREWIADCAWADLDEDEDDIAALSNAEIVAGVAKHYDGGIAGFMATLEKADPFRDSRHSELAAAIKAAEVGK